MKVISYGGGVQSTALIVLAAKGEIDYKLALIANVGDDSESPATLVYVRTRVIPWAKERGIEIVELHKYRKDGERETLLERIERSGKSVPIPMRLTNGMPGNRQCTGDFKIGVVAKELKRLGATRESPASVAMGISIDEYKRMRDSSVPHEVFDYPLIDMKLSRDDCQQIIIDAGLPPAPKSSCYFCPFHNIAAWQELRRDTPDLFAKAEEIEAGINRRRAEHDRPPVWMTRKGIPLAQAIALYDDTEEVASCDIAGYCHS